MSEQPDPKPERTWTVYLIQHSHTDIGYTQMQSRIGRHHVAFLDQAIEIAKQVSTNPSLSGFRWTNECFWSVEEWLKANSPARIDELVECIRAGAIGLSATYLHFNELIDDELLRAAIHRAVSFARAHDLPLDTALSADINGFSWGYSQALVEAGITNLVTSIHSHHGLAPFGRRQYPFFWETPSGQELFVWSGEHYQMGNAMGLAPGAVLTYGFADEFHPATRTMDTRALAVRAAAALPLPVGTRRLSP